MKNTMNDVHALVFDLGGVVIDIDFNRAFSRWAAHANCEPEILRSKFSQTTSYEHHETGEMGDPAYFESLRQAFGIDITDAQFLDGWNAIYVGEMLGISELLAAAQQKWPLYALTNTNTAHHKVWSQIFAETLSVFDQVFVSSEMGLRKPEPEIFHTVAKTIDIHINRMLFFDDNLENVEGARRAGMQAEHVTSTEEIRARIAGLL